MNSIKKVVLAAFLSILSVTAPGTAGGAGHAIDQPPKDDRPLPLRATALDARVALTEFLSDRKSAGAREACKATCDALPVQNADSIEAFAFASMAADMRGELDGALGFLRQGIKKYPQDKIELWHAQDIGFQALGQLWVAHLLQGGGRPQAALKAYARARTVSRGTPAYAPAIDILCLIQEAEIYRLQLNQPAKGVEMLKSVAGMASGDSEVSTRGVSTPFYKEWASYVLHSIEHPEEETAPDDEYAALDMNAVDEHLRLLGITRPVFVASPAIGAPEMIIFREDYELERTYVEHVLAKVQSPFLRDACLLRLGLLGIRTERYAEAEAALRNLFDSPSYLAPLAMPLLRQCVGDSLKAQELNIEYLKRFLNYENRLRREEQCAREEMRSNQQRVYDLRPTHDSLRPTP